MIVTFSNVGPATRRAACSVARALDADLVIDGDHEGFRDTAADVRSTGGDLVAVLKTDTARLSDVRDMVDLAVIVVHDDRSATEAAATLRNDDASRPPRAAPIWVLDLRTGAPGRLSRHLPSKSGGVAPSPSNGWAEHGLQLAGMSLLAAFDPWSESLTRYGLAEALDEEGGSAELRERLMALAAKLDDLHEARRFASRTMRRDRRSHLYRGSRLERATPTCGYAQANRLALKGDAR